MNAVQDFNHKKFPRWWFTHNVRQNVASILMISFCSGCWSAPVTRGHWRGTMSIQPMCNYEGDQICNATIIHLIDGDTLPPSIGYSLFLLGPDYTAIDPATFANARVVDVSGAVSRTEVRDKRGTMITTAPGTVTGLTASLSIESVHTYSDHKLIPLIYPVLVPSKIKLPALKGLQPGADQKSSIMP